jgi:hypothetical protein
MEGDENAPVTHPTGKVKGDLVVTREDENKKTYMAGLFGGRERVRMIGVRDNFPDVQTQLELRQALEDRAGEVCQLGAVEIEVKVPDLKRMEDVMGAVGNFNLVGQTPQHGDNHYGTENSVNIVDDVAQQYAASNGLLKINDMSLEWGGLFDVCGKWDPTQTCVLSGITTKGHNLHRVGKSVDINRRDASGTPININRLKQLFQMWGAWKVNEGPIHFEMP